MFPILLAAFIAVPILEIWLLLRVGTAIGGGTTILVVIFTAVLGAYLVRQQGFATLSSVQNQVNAGRVPAMEMAEGLALLVAGALLMTPGFFTDAIGFTLLTPPLRRAIIRWFTGRVNFSVHGANSVHTPSPNWAADARDKTRETRSETVIEGEYSERE